MQTYTVEQPIFDDGGEYGVVYHLDIPNFGELYHAVLPGFERPVALLATGTALFIPADLKAKAPTTKGEIGAVEWLDLYTRQYALNLNGLPYTIK